MHEIFFFEQNKKRFLSTDTVIFTTKFTFSNFFFLQHGTI